MQEKVAVVIPIYKTELTGSEQKSLEQCLVILKKYPLVIIHPKHLDIAGYRDFFRSYSINLFFKAYDERFFENIKGYNELLLSPFFYNEFIDYEYILTYQLDSWVFKDELVYWCRKGYDYIGAPWFEGYHEALPNSKLLNIAGNGGLSLRNINSFLKVLMVQNTKVLSVRDIWEHYTEYNMARQLIRIPKMLWAFFNQKNTSQFFLKEYIKENRNEDYFFSIYAPKIITEFRVAPSRVALKFSFECNPSVLYRINQNSLPFGCHGWERYEPDFWHSMGIN